MQDDWPTEKAEISAPDVGIVVIGRNEGQRLIDCLRLLGRAHPVVYVDSGSSDGSREAATAQGAEVVLLDQSRPFTAARARNGGFKRLLASHPGLRFVQFVDGDCQLDPGWIGPARSFLEEHADAAVACGRRREKHPDRSIYNALCDREWDTPIGEAAECGGDSLVRVEAFEAVNGFSDELIAGEEPDLCARLRARGFSIWRLDIDMSRHDAAITRFGQWWRRSRRAGHAFAEVSHGGRPAPYRAWKRNVRRAVFWALGLPVVAALGAVLVHPAALLLLAAYPLQVVRVALREPPGALPRLAYAFFSTLGKFPELQGVLTFHRNRLIGRRQAVIDYKAMTETP